MKQRKQIISESVHSLSTAIDLMREIACDLADCQISPVQLTTSIDAIEKFRQAVVLNELRPTLMAPTPPADPESEPCIHCGAPIDESGIGHDEGCTYETAEEKSYNASFASHENAGELMSDPTHTCDFCAKPFKQSTGEVFEDNPADTYACPDCSPKVSYCQFCETLKIQGVEHPDGTFTCTTCCDATEEIAAEIANES